MPGTSRMPISLRESFNNVRKRSRVRAANPLEMLSLDL
jgi:sphinganine-1-phosphate aldolase